MVEWWGFQFDMPAAHARCHILCMPSYMEGWPKVLSEAMRKGLHEHFHHTVERKGFARDDVRAGREYVEAYVPYIHYVEQLWQAASGTAHGHHAEEEPHVHAH